MCLHFLCEWTKHGRSWFLCVVMINPRSKFKFSNIDICFVPFIFFISHYLITFGSLSCYISIRFIYYHILIIIYQVCIILELEFNIITKLLLIILSMMISTTPIISLLQKQTFCTRPWHDQKTFQILNYHQTQLTLDS